MKGQRVMMCALIVTLLLALGVAGTRAQEQQPQEGISAINELSVELNDAIPIQGRLTDENGVPLDGVFDIRFAVYLQTGLFSTWFVVRARCGRMRASMNVPSVGEGCCAREMKWQCHC